MAYWASNQWSRKLMAMSPGREPSPDDAPYRKPPQPGDPDYTPPPPLPKPPVKLAEKPTQHKGMMGIPDSEEEDTKFHTPWIDKGHTEDHPMLAPDLGPNDIKESDSWLQAGAAQGGSGIGRQAYFDLGGSRGFISPQQGAAMLKNPSAYKTTPKEIEIIRYYLQGGIEGV